MTTVYPKSQLANGIELNACADDEVLSSVIPWHLKYYHSANALSLKYLGRFWIFQYIGAPYPGVIPHFSKNLKKSFYRITYEQGEGVSTFFNRTGITAFAMCHEGVCTFRIGRKLCLYQGKNVQLFDDVSLSPLTLSAKKIHDDFLDSYPYSDRIKRHNKQPLLQLLATAKSLQYLQPFVQKYGHNFIENSLDQTVALEDFYINIIAYIDSYLPGVIDVTQRPLNSYLASSESDVMKGFLKFFQKTLEDKRSQLIPDLIRGVISDNFESILAAPESNIVKQYFKIFQIQFNKDSILDLPQALLKELAVIIVTLFETSALSLYWLICYIEKNSVVKQKVIAEAAKPLNLQETSYIELIIMENLRLVGANPTPMSRQVIKKTTIKYHGFNVPIQKGTMVWLNRRAANHDISVFPSPYRFSKNNVRSIFTSDDESFFSVFGNKHDDINSFSMVNAFGNPRKCPGRCFSIMVQSSIIREIYANYNICCEETACSGLRKYSFMAKPDNQATISLTKH